jgi:hypothetical protein
MGKKVRTVRKSGQARVRPDFWAGPDPFFFKFVLLELGRTVNFETMGRAGPDTARTLGCRTFGPCRTFRLGRTFGPCRTLGPGRTFGQGRTFGPCRTVSDLRTGSDFRTEMDFRTGSDFRTDSDF